VQGIKDSHQGNEGKDVAHGKAQTVTFKKTSS